MKTLIINDIDMVLDLKTEVSREIVGGSQESAADVLVNIRHIFNNDENVGNDNAIDSLSNVIFRLST